MRTTVPCPICQHTLTFIAVPRALACPFCRATIEFRENKIPVGKKVRCVRCRGVFTAESPPPQIRVFASKRQACPFCQVPLAIREDLPPGKKVRCYKCRKKFYPGHKEKDAPAGTLPEPQRRADHAHSHESFERALATVPSAAQHGGARTHLVLSNGSSRSSITQLAPSPPEVTTHHESATLAESDVVDFFSRDRNAVQPSETPPPALQVAPTAARRSVDEQVAEPLTSAPDSSNSLEPDAVMPAPEVEDETNDVAIEVENPEFVEEAPAPDLHPPSVPPPPPPLSSNSLERDAATALLEAEDETNDVAVEVENPEFVEEVPAPDLPAPSVPLPAPSPPAGRPPSKPTATTRPGLEIDWKKVLAYAVPILLVGAGVYYFFFTKSSGKQTVFAAEGIVLFEGKPATGARVTLYPEVKTRNRYFPTGKVGPDGTFRLTTYAPDDGAPAGRYKVTIIRGQMEQEEYAELSKKHTPEEVQKISEKMSQDPLCTKYANPRESGLTADITNAAPNKLEYKID